MRGKGCASLKVAALTLSRPYGFLNVLGGLPPSRPYDVLDVHQIFFFFLIPTKKYFRPVQSMRYMYLKANEIFFSMIYNSCYF